MNPKHTNPQENWKILHLNDIITCIYLSLIVCFLLHNNLILKFGQYENIYVIIIIASGELLKYLIYSSKTRSTHKKHATKDFFKSVLVLFSVFVIFYVISVLFGAPIFSNFEETCMFALLLTTLTVLPTCLHLGPDTTINMLLSLTLYEGEEINKMFMTKMRLCLFGAWLGAIPIPLDWNRPWQDWPITCCVGALLGYIAGNLFTSLLQFQKTGKTTRKTGKFV